MSDVVLAARGITVRFPGVLANDAVDFDLCRGEVHAVLGENGAGKSTLMNVLSGLDRPDAGTILVDGEPVQPGDARAALARGIGMVHQHSLLVPVFSVLDNVVLGQEPVAHGLLLDRRAVRARLQALAAEYGLSVDPDAVVRDLPVGAQQRVEIVRALYRGARVLILDEPTAVLTPPEADALLRALRALTAKGTAIAFITHKLSEALAIADRITVLRRGRVVASLTPAETSEAALATLMVGGEVPVDAGPPGTPTATEVLRVDGLVVRDERGLAAVDGVSLTVHAGEIVGVAGVQGNGQTELVEALAGLRRAERGTIWRDGAAVTGQGPRALRDGGLAHVPEDRRRTGLVGGFCLADNLVLSSYDRAPFARHGVLDGEAITRHAHDRLTAFDVRPPDPGALAEQLSGGNQQKVVLAREIGPTVDLLLANQPTRGLDVGAVAQVHHWLRDLRTRGGGILLVSADLDEIRTLADRVLVMVRGRLVEAPADADAETLGLLMAGVGTPLTESRAERDPS